MSLIDRVGTLAGVGAAIYFLFLPVPTSEVNVEPGQASSEIAEALAGNRGPARLGASLGLIAVVLLVTFFCRFYGELRNASERDSWLPLVTLAGGILLAVVLLFEIGIAYAASELSSYGDETQIAKLFVLWEWNSATLFAPPFALILLSTTVVATSVSAFPNWYRWATMGLLVLLLLIAGFIGPGLAIAPGTLWMFFTSLMLGTRSPRVATRSATP